MLDGIKFSLIVSISICSILHMTNMKIEKVGDPELSRSMPYAVPATPWVSHTRGNLNLIITVTININILFIILSIILFIILIIIIYNALTWLQFNLKADSQYNQDTTRLDHPQSLFYFMPQPSRIQLNSLMTQSNLVAIQFHKRQNCRAD